MTHARKKPILLLKRSAGSAGQALSPVDGERMDRTEVEDSEQGNGTEGQNCQSRFAGVNKSKNSQELRKTYPLRKRLSSSVDKKTCTVLLTRLEDVAGSLSQETQNGMKRGFACCVDEFKSACFPETVQVVGAGKPDSSGGKYSVSCLGAEQEGYHTSHSEPRKRRLASLNAEAVNNLLFERDDGLLSGRRFRKDSLKVSGGCTNSTFCKSQGTLPLMEKSSSKMVKGKHQTKSGQKSAAFDQSLDDVFEGKRREDSGISYHPAPKRLASLNAAAFMKLTHEKDQPLKPRSKSTGDSKPENHRSRSKLKWAKANGKNCVKSKKEVATINTEGQHSWQGVTEGAFRKVIHQDSPRIYGRTESINYEPLPNSCEGMEGFCHRLPLLMGGQASMKPEYGRPGEKSPTPKQEFHQPSFPVPQFPPLPVPGNHPDCGCLYESSDLTPLNGFYVYYGQSGYNSYTHCSVYPKDELSQVTGCEGLLVSPDSLTSDPSFQPFHWCSSPYCCGEGPAINSYSLCGVMRVPESRIGNVHTGRNSYPYKMPFAADQEWPLPNLTYKKGRMAEWVKQQAEREADKEQRRLERLKRKLVEPKHFFTNPDYQQQCHEMAERLEDSVLKGMQASSGPMVSPVSTESRKRPNESVKEAMSEKKRCFWLGVDGLEESDNSQGSSDSEDDESASTSGSCTTSAGSQIKMCDRTELCPSSSEDSISYTSVLSTPEKPQVQMEDNKKDPAEDRPLDPTTANEKHEATNTPKEGEQANSSSAQKPVNQLPGTKTSTKDLLSFSSAAELEALGLDELKCELMALGLKCGGTLQERAARLFSVRGLSRAQIDPALFAKLPKVKKK